MNLQQAIDAPSWHIGAFPAVVLAAPRAPPCWWLRGACRRATNQGAGAPRPTRSKVARLGPKPPQGAASQDGPRRKAPQRARHGRDRTAGR